jgi:hypothetical protein
LTNGIRALVGGGDFKTFSEAEPSEVVPRATHLGEMGPARDAGHRFREESMNASGWSHWKNEGILVFVLVSVGAAGACRGPESEYLMDADRAAIQAVTDSALAIANGSKNWVAFADTYFAPDAVLMPPNHDAIEGRGAIAA